MHPLIDQKTVERIRSTGNGLEGLPDRRAVLEEYGLPYDRPAENVIISGCQILPFLPHDVEAVEVRVVPQVEAAADDDCGI